MFRLLSHQRRLLVRLQEVKESSADIFSLAAQLKISEANEKL